MTPRRDRVLHSPFMTIVVAGTSFPSHMSRKRLLKATMFVTKHYLPITLELMLRNAPFDDNVAVLLVELTVGST